MYTQEKYNLLIDQLIKYEDQYYNQDFSEITDAEFDSLYFEAKTIEELHNDWIRIDSPIKRIMGKSIGKLKEVKHTIPLLSLGKVMNFDELKKWLLNLYNLNINQFFVECKHDGLACSLHYHQGKFIQGVTRGNGLIGNDVTQTCWQIPSIPKEINYLPDLEVRGEIFLTKSGLEEINDYIKKYQPKDTIKKNVRNTASGLLRDETPNPRKSKYLYFSAYMSLDTENDTHGDSMKFLQSLGFLTTDNFVKNFVINLTNDEKKFKKLQQCLDAIHQQRSEMDFDIDGLVFKVNNYEQQKFLGNKREEPNWAIAYKFPQTEKVSVLKSVRWDLGPKGNITPVAFIEPVEILGAMVENPTLHNIDEINRLDLKIGDHIVITRRGDVIPKIIKVLPELRDGSEMEIEIPELCPICGSKLVFKDVYIRCENEQCQGRIAGKIIDFVIKLEIKDFGEKLINALVKRKTLTNIADIYRLKVSDISVLEKQGVVSATKIIKHIEKSKQASLAQIIAGLGIANIGEVTGKNIADFYLTLSNFKQAKVQELLQMDNIGPTVANTIVKWIKDNEDLIDDMISLNLGMKDAQIIKSNKLKDKLFAFTGALSKSRNEFQKIITDNGGNFSVSIKQGINYLIIGSGAKQHKIDKAKKLGAEIISENDFYKLLTY